MPPWNPDNRQLSLPSSTAPFSKLSGHIWSWHEYACKPQDVNPAHSALFLFWSLTHANSPDPTDMIERGFEYTLKHGEPRNPDSKRYRLQPKCCGIEFVATSTRWMRCAHPWHPSAEVPLGDPFVGGNWTFPWPDIGTYEGGRF